LRRTLQALDKRAIPNVTAKPLGLVLGKSTRRLLHSYLVIGLAKINLPLVTPAKHLLASPITLGDGRRVGNDISVAAEIYNLPVMRQSLLLEARLTRLQGEHSSGIFAYIEASRAITRASTRGDLF
jgi:hypothetical protein